jgi:outer membrane protein assembly factor BamD (BamD/ComL family)
MRRSQRSCFNHQLLFHPALASNTLASNFRPMLLLFLLGLPAVVPAHSQDAGAPETQLFGRGVAISVGVHEASGEPISSPAIVKLFRGRTIPDGQAETVRGRAELFTNNLGDFTVVVEAAGYANAQKDLSINAGGRVDVDIYLRRLSLHPSNLPGRPLLAPKARKAVDEGLQALDADHLSQAQIEASKAKHLAPGHPDVLYLQGLIFLKQRDWTGAQEVLEKATQVDPTGASAFAALGMALCDQGKYEAAVSPLEKALQLNPASTWDTRWTLAKAYYQQARYEQALQMSETALSSSNGKAPEIELLVAQALTAVGRYEDAAQALREFIHNHADRREVATARRWLNGLSASGKIRAD